MKIDIVNPLDIPDWDEQILRLPAYSFFHCSAWARVLSEAYCYKPLYFTIFNDKAISACLPMMEVNSFITGKRGVSLPFTDYCEPLVQSANEFYELFARAVKYGEAHGWEYLELRGGSSFLNGKPASAAYLGHTLDLTRNTDRSIVSAPCAMRHAPCCDGSQQLESVPGSTRHPTPCTPKDVSPSPQSPVPSPLLSSPVLSSDCLFSSLRDSTRRNVRKAEKEGVKTEFAETIDTVLEFCRLNSISRKRHSLPPQPIGFFKAVHRHVISKGLGFVVLASQGGDVVAGSIFFVFGHKAIYKYGASGMDKQQFRPNNLVMWRAIKRLSENGFESVNFGRTEPQHIGLLQFKAGWRPTEWPIAYYRYDRGMACFCGPSQGLGRSQRAIFGKMPIPALNLIGSLAYKHMG